MLVSIVYGFDSAQIANRFLNDVNSHKALGHAKARLFDTNKVRIQYNMVAGDYDSTLSVLDDLADSYGGKEHSSK
ncbi:hypothetical protein PN836_019520 [Ningiella sp. W23]|uniref:hypothetical protein n=1 Tax=Ningiella sp. W23 TaxID=3023715 RepID=UPI0037582FAA